MPTAITTPLNDVVQQFENIQKGGLGELQGLGAKLRKDKPIALSFQLGQQSYDVDIATKYIEFLLLTDRDMMVLILDQSRHFVAMTEGTTMLTLLKNQGPQITRALAMADKTFFVNLPGFHTNSPVDGKPSTSLSPHATISSTLYSAAPIAVGSTYWKWYGFSSRHEARP